MPYQLVNTSNNKYKANNNAVCFTSRVLTSYIDVVHSPQWSTYVRSRQPTRQGQSSCIRVCRETPGFTTLCLCLWREERKRKRGGGLALLGTVRRWVPSSSLYDCAEGGIGESSALHFVRPRRVSGSS